MSDTMPSPIFSWRALREQLLGSPFLDELTDDLTTQRGIVAASVAVAGRMADAVPGTWVPQRHWGRPQAPRARAEAAHAFKPPPPSGGPGGAGVAPKGSPRAPQPGGAAVQPEVITF